jgi:enoyl-CoA hydratase/carnithine racemase
MSHLTHTIEHGIATIILDRSPQNRIDDQMVDELATAINAIERSDARVVLVRAEGENFSFGGDIMPWPDDTPRQLRARTSDHHGPAVPGRVRTLRNSSPRAERPSLQAL